MAEISGQMGFIRQIGYYFDYIIKVRKRLPGIVIFMYRGAVLLLLYLLFYEQLRYHPFIDVPYEFVTQQLTSGLLHITSFTLELVGYDVSVQGKIIRIAGTGGVLLDKGCLGRNLLLLFAGFLVIYPGRWQPKVWYIPLGLVLIFILNLIRIGGLTLISHEAPEYLDVNHDIIFKYSVYALTFVLWMIYINKLSKPRKKTAPPNDKAHA